MKNLTVVALFFISLLIPTAWALPVGETFTFRVEEAVIIKGNREVPFRSKSIPKGVPYYKKGKLVTFVIGEKGELKGPRKLSIPFKDEELSQANFNGKRGTNGAAVFKIPYEEVPIKVLLSYIRKMGNKTTYVYYTLY